jgi:hypothetical protein
MILELWSGNVQAYEALLNIPCTISYHRGLPIHMDCLVRSSMSQGMLRIVKTPDGKTFRIENDNTGKWLLNRKRAIKTSDEPHPCYRNPEVEICFDE